MDASGLENEISLRRNILKEAGRLVDNLAPSVPVENVSLEKQIGKGGFSTVYAVDNAPFSSDLPLAAKCYDLANLRRNDENVDSALRKLLARFVTLGDDSSISENCDLADKVVLPCAYGMTDEKLIVFMEKFQFHFGQYNKEIRHIFDDKKEIGSRLMAVYIEAARGLNALHTAGYRHQDVKSTNLLVNRDTDFNPTKVCWTDFEIVGLQPEAGNIHDGATELITSSGIMIGTPRYWPPSFILGQRTLREVANIIDNYALGLMMAETLFDVDMQPPTDAIAKTKVEHQTSFRKWDHLEQLAEDYGLPGIERVIIRLTDEVRGY